MQFCIEQTPKSMAALIISPENQIQRLNLIMNKVGELRQLDRKALTMSPSPKAWSVMEIIAHLNISYGNYREKIDKALAQSPAAHHESETFRARPWQKWVINGQKPKGNVRPWKMKTFKKFEPKFAKGNLDDSKIEQVFASFEELHRHLKQSILASRHKQVDKLKVSSAIGPIVTFYLPECFEFIISHAERHIVQIQEVLD